MLVAFGLCWGAPALADVGLANTKDRVESIAFLAPLTSSDGDPAGAFIELEHAPERDLPATPARPAVSKKNLSLAIATRELRITIFEDEVSESTCLFETNRDNLVSCGDVRNGNANIDANYCVTYTPNPGFTGTDTLCAITCSMPGSMPCDTTVLIIEVQPLPVFEPEEVFLDHVGDTPFLACFDLPKDDDFLAAQLCGVSGPTTAEPSGARGCVRVSPDAGAEGNLTVCADFCLTDSPSLCQRVTFRISQVRECEPAVFASDTLRLPESATSDEVCLADGANLNNFFITINGDPADTAEDPSCGTTEGGGGGGVRDAYFYGTFLLNDGPYRIEGWDANGRLLRGVMVDSFAQLADTLSSFDPDLDWVYDEAEGGIVGSGAVGNYSQLILFDPVFGTTLTINRQTIQVSDDGGSGSGTFVPGTVVTIPATPGLYHVEAVRFDGSCGATQVILREGEIAEPPATSTENFTVRAEQLNGPYCLDTSELPGPATSISSCADPMEGTLGFSSESCFTYTPRSGYTGNDEACVVVCAADGTCDTTFLVFDVVDASSCVSIWGESQGSTVTTNCAAGAMVCLPKLPSSFFNYTISVDGTLRTDATACGADTVTIYSYADVAGRGQAGPYRVDRYRSPTGIFSGSVDDMSGLVDSLNRWDPAGIWSLNAGTFTIRGGVSGFAYDTLRLTQIASDTINRLVPNTTLLENQLGLVLETGEREVVVTESATGCTDTLMYTVTCASDVDCGDILASNGTDLTLVDCATSASFEITSQSTPAQLLDFYVNGQLREPSVDGNVAMLFLDTGSYEIIVVDAGRDCSTTFSVSVACGGCDGVLPTSLAYGVNCSATSYDICLPVSVDDLAPYTISVDGTPFLGPRLGCEDQRIFEINYLELPGSGNAGPYSIDSFRINGQVFAADISSIGDLADSLSLWDATADWSVDTERETIRGGDISSQYSQLFVTQIATDAQVTLDLVEAVDSDATRITIAAGAGARELVLDNGRGCVQSIPLSLTCVTTGSVSDTIDVRESIIFCVDENELTGPIVSLSNACENSGAAVDFDFDAPTGCVIATGIAVGQSTACLVACDASGVCDTTIYTVLILPEAGDVEAVDDFFRIAVGSSLTESVTANDTFDVLTRIRLERSPSQGTASLDNDGVLVYAPNAEACGFTDSLTYSICQGGLCDIATVAIRVRCEPVEALQGFSPNGDGINEFFVIEGILDFPEATVSVYNRWGNLVFEETTYSNDWDGIWDGNRLISGTYFYLVEFNGSADGAEPVAGYVQIWR